MSLYWSLIVPHVPHCPPALSLGLNKSRVELVLPLLPPQSNPTPSGLIQNYSGHP